MRYNKLILPIVLALFVLPLAALRSAAATASQPDAQGFRILLSDGSVVKGAVSFTMNIDTQYGRLTVPSMNFISARFNSTDGWADISTNDVQLRVQYKPATSSLKVLTDLGPVNVDLTKVITVESLNAEALNAAPVPPADTYSQPATAVDVTPYEYGAPAPYYSPSYYAPTPYCYPYGYSYSYPFFWWPGFAFSVSSRFDHDHHEHHDGFDHRDGFDRGFRGHDAGVVFRGSGAAHSAAASARHFNGMAGLSGAASGRTFSSTTFRSAAAPTFRSAGTSMFRSAAAPTFRSGSAPAFRSAGTSTFRSVSAPSFRSGGGFSGGGFSGGGFSGGGFSRGGFGGGRGR